MRHPMNVASRRLLACALLLSASSIRAEDPLPSWADGAARRAILEFVQATTTPGSPAFVPAEERIAAFDQDGTLWVEHPMYAQVTYCLERVPALVKARPELADAEPFRTVMQALQGDRSLLGRLGKKDLETIAAATLTGTSVDQFRADVKEWLARARDPRWRRPYTDLAYLPMQELLRYLRQAGFKTYIVTGGGQDFVRVYAEAVYGIPPEQVVGTAGATRFGYGKDGKPVLTKSPRLVLDDDGPGKPEGIHLMIGRRPLAAFGNSTGDREMLEYVKAGEGRRLAMLVLHDDAKREYAYGPAQGLPDSTVGTFPQSLHDAAARSGWIVVSMKADWKKILAD